MHTVIIANWERTLLNYSRLGNVSTYIYWFILQLSRDQRPKNNYNSHLPEGISIHEGGKQPHLPN